MRRPRHGSVRLRHAHPSWPDGLAVHLVRAGVDQERPVCAGRIASGSDLLLPGLSLLFAGVPAPPLPGKRDARGSSQYPAQPPLLCDLDDWLAGRGPSRTAGRIAGPVLCQAGGGQDRAGMFLMVLAEAPAAWVGGQLAQMLPMFVLIVVVFCFVIYRPQKQQREKHQALISQLKKGDKVVTSGGIWGTVTNVGKETVTLQVAENAKIKVARDHILRVRGD